MKIRNGFVSNSSSSSFIVAFTKVPKNEIELKKMLFGDESRLEYCDDVITTHMAAHVVFEDMYLQKPTRSVEKLTEIIMDSWFNEYDGLPGRSDWDSKLYLIKDDKERMRRIMEEEKEDRKNARAIAKRFLENNRDCKIYIFTYSDNDGDEGAILEHGGTFSKLTHITLNQH